MLIRIRWETGTLLSYSETDSSRRCGCWETGDLELGGGRLPGRGDLWLATMHSVPLEWKLPEGRNLPVLSSAVSPHA